MMEAIAALTEGERHIAEKIRAPPSILSKSAGEISDQPRALFGIESWR
jgi:hypothetical protein